MNYMYCTVKKKRACKFGRGFWPISNIAVESKQVPGLTKKKKKKKASCKKFFSSYFPVTFPPR